MTGPTRQARLVELARLLAQLRWLIQEPPPAGITAPAEPIATLLYQIACEALAWKDSEDQ